MPALSDAQIAASARKAGFPESEIPMAVAIVRAESGGDPEAKSPPNKDGSVDYGLFQINTVHGGLLNIGNRYNPDDNARMAYRVWKDAGGKWTPWSTYNSGSYKPYFKGSNVDDKGKSGSPWALDSIPWLGDKLPGDPVIPQAMWSIQGLVENFTKVGQTLADRSIWQRVGIGAAGVLIILVAIAWANKEMISPGGKIGMAAKLAKGVAK